MKNYIKNKTVLITGSTSGIGKEIAIDLAKMGLNLVLVGRSMIKLEKLKNELAHLTNKNIFLLEFDIRAEKDVNSKISSILKQTNLDILINNAGLALGADSIDKGSVENWDNMIDTNIKGLLYVSKAIISQMKTLDTAHIINIGSVAGKTAYPGGNVYCATKAAVHSITDAMNSDLYGTNIKVTTIAPGAVNTNFSNVRFDGNEEKIHAVYKGYVPLTASDISNTIIMVLNTPPHVNIQYIDIMPTAQRNPFQIYRN